jgi:alkylation response protein AidB-like acyl-CoA dehydrogenase
MPTYRAPVDDWQFLLHDVLRIGDLGNLPGFADLSPDFTAQVLGAAAQFHEEVLHPMNQRGDAEGARIQEGRVHTPSGFKAAWNAYREAGWHRLSLSTSLGGAGLPPVMAVPVTELRASTGHSFSMYSSFCAPAASMLAALGAPWMREHVVPRLSDGDWTATMCMTEPQAGTDLRQLSTRALRQPDGSWRLHGRKIFISGGDHDMTDNIVHIVLAKVPDENGRVGASLSSVHVFLVSTRALDPATGTLGGANGVHVRSIEHKMGIEGSATCAMDFEDAVGWRIGGEAEAGVGNSSNMAPMFFLMNYARVGTAMSGVGYAEIARQNAADYARERLSGRAGPVPTSPQRVADPIIAHADVRRLLLEARSFTEGARAGAMRAALWQSLAEHSEDRAERERAQDLLDLLTPVMKAFFTDRGFDATVACQQVLGGHGYIKDYGLEQFVRNARIGQLYEGANGIQATDLVHRKLGAHGGRAARHFMMSIAAFIERHQARDELAPFTTPLQQGLARVDDAIEWVRSHAASAPQAVSAAAYDLLTALGILYLGWTWAEIAAVATAPSGVAFLDAAGRQRKIELARVWMVRQMPLIDSLCRRIESGNDSLLALPDDLI